MRSVLFTVQTYMKPNTTVWGSYNVVAKTPMEAVEKASEQLFQRGELLRGVIFVTDIDLA